MKKLILHITGMSCGHCLHAVNQALGSTPAIQLESLRMGRAVLSYDEQKTDPAAIEALIAGAGYTAVAAASDVGAAKEQR